MDDLYVVRVHSRRGKQGGFRAAVEHVGTRDRYHFDSVPAFIGFFEERCAPPVPPDPPPADPDRSAA